MPDLEDLTARTKIMPCEEAYFLEAMVDKTQMYNQLSLFSSAVTEYLRLSNL